MNDEFISWEEAVIWLKNQSDKQELVMSCFYDDPLLDSVKRYHQSTEWKAVKNLLSDLSKGRALDIGAGRGISSYALAKDGWQVTALEPDPSLVVGTGAIRTIVRSGYDIEVVEEFAENLPFDDNSFDLVYGRAVMHHAKNLDTFCREIFRILKPEGSFLLTRDHVIDRDRDLQLFLDTHPLHSLYQGEHAYLLSEYMRAIRNVGLKIQKIFLPYDSDINLFPSNRDELRNNFSRKLKINVPKTLFEYIVIPLLNLKNKTPGRLYSFMGTKP